MLFRSIAVGNVGDEGDGRGRAVVSGSDQCDIGSRHLCCTLESKRRRAGDYRRGDVANGNGLDAGGYIEAGVGGFVSTGDYLRTGIAVGNVGDEGDGRGGAVVCGGHQGYVGSGDLCCALESGIPPRR